MLSEGYVLKKFNMSTRPIQGSLYSLTPVSDFPEILPNSTRDLFGILYFVISILGVGMTSFVWT
jgi:hypothetical protein